MSIKKVELHVHLEGTIRPSVARELATINKLSIPAGLIAADDISYISHDFMHFLSVYDTLAALIKTPQDYYTITLDYLEQRAKADTLYVEMMYSPDHAEMVSGIPSREHLVAIQQAIDDAEAKWGIIGRIIITAVRHFGVDSCVKVAQNAIRDKLPCVTGFGLGGDEINFPPQLFSRAYLIAATEAGLLCTVHAGEFASADSMLTAIDTLPIKRIGHGVQAIHSVETIERLKSENIALEICPSSNIKLGLFPDIQSHPLPKLLSHGVNISLNSDDPPFMQTTLEQEYDLVQIAYNYSDVIMRNITTMAINAAFVDEKTKLQLHNRNI